MKSNLERKLKSDKIKTSPSAGEVKNNILLKGLNVVLVVTRQTNYIISLRPQCAPDATEFLSDVYKRGTRARKFLADGVQYGRSMIEMLGVLAIIAVLSIGGIAGYSKAMQQWKISRQKQQIAEIFLQCINLKDDFSREWSKTNVIVPTASIMEAMNVIPDGLKKHSDYNLNDKENNNIMIYAASWNGQPSGYEYRLIFTIAQTDKSNHLAQEYCVTFLEQAQAIKPYIYYIERRSYDTSNFQDGYSSDLFDINKANPANMRNFCKICEAKSFCDLHLKFKL